MLSTDGGMQKTIDYVVNKHYKLKNPKDCLKIQ